MRWVITLTLAAGVSVLSAAVPAVAVPPDDTVVGTIPGSVPDTTIDAPPADTAVTSPPATGDGGPTSVDDDRGDVSIWWWIGGGFVAAAAAYGLAYSLRRRTGVEEWARSASVACDIGRAMSLTVSSRLDDTTPWVRPVRWTEQHARFGGLLAELSSSVPERDFPELLAAVVAADASLVSAIDEVADGTPTETARTVLQPALDVLGTALTALEHEATITVFGASLPSSRTTG